MLSRGLLVLSLENKRLRRCISYRDLLFPQTAPNYCGRNLGASNQQLELLVTQVLDLGSDLDNLRKRTNVIGRGQAIQNPFDVEIRPRRISQTKESTRTLRVSKQGLGHRLCVYLFVMGERLFYSGRTENRARRLWRNPRMAKYGKRSRKYWR